MSLIQKFLLLSAIIIFSYYSSEAQRRPYDPEEPLVGIRFGGSATFVSEADPLLVFDPVLGDTFNVISEGTRPGLQAGLWFRFPLYPFYFQPAVLVSGHKASYSFEGVNAAPFAEDLVWQIEAPIAIGVKILFIRAQAGIVPTIFVARGPVNDENTWDDIFNTATMNWQLGAGLDIGRRFTVDARVEGPIGYYRDKIAVGGVGYTYTYKTNKIIAGVGFVF